MSLGVSLALTLVFVFVVGVLSLAVVFIKAKAENARRSREDLVLLLKERRPSLDHTLERLGQDEKQT